MSKNQKNHLQATAVRLARAHYCYVLAFVASILLFDAFELITPASVLERWTLAAIMVMVTTVVWHGSRFRAQDEIYHKALIYGLVIMDIVVATFMVYAERGMASRGVALFAVPLVVSAALASRTAIFATASLCVAAYSLAAVRYFVLNFNEGYKIELYGIVGFYSIIFLVVAALLWAIVRPKNN